jgi:prevent-host-death family protein
MKTIDIRKAVGPLADYAQAVDKEAVVVTKNGKPVAVLSSARGMDKESIALANSPTFASIIQRARARHAKEGGIPLDEVYRRLGIPRRAKRSRRTKR